MQREVVFVDGLRTPFGRMGGSLRTITPVELAGLTIKGLCDRTKLLEKGSIDAVFIGSASGDLNTHNFARYASLLAGLPYETSATFIEMQCGSSIACINNAALQIKSGLIDTAICGGSESHSQMYYKYSTAVEAYKGIAPTPAPLRLAPMHEDNISMIEIADSMAKVWGVTREACDAFAFRSQQLASNGIDKGYFQDEILSVEVKYSKKSNKVIINKDEHPRGGTTIESLSKLIPIHQGGVTTAGNASGRNDGSAFILLMSAEKANEMGYSPIARWVTGADVGVDPKLMGIGPAYSNSKILNRAGLKLRDIDIYECNEAFAAQNLCVIKKMEEMFNEKINLENWNPNGGAIAFGHPNGASGARIAISTIKELRRRSGKYGLLSACCGGGLGISTLVENIL